MQIPFSVAAYLALPLTMHCHGGHYARSQQCKRGADVGLDIGCYFKDTIVYSSHMVLKVGGKIASYNGKNQHWHRQVLRVNITLL